jgi:hypothetical protein
MLKYQRRNAVHDYKNDFAAHLERNALTFFTKCYGVPFLLIEEGTSTLSLLLLFVP